MQNVLVTGGAGGVGLSVCLCLVRREYRVTALVAPWDPPERVKELGRHHVAVYTGDVRDADGIAVAFQGQNALVHTAARLPEGGVGNRPAQYAVNVEGTRNVLRLARRHGLQRAVHISTAGVASHQEEGSAGDGETAPYRNPQNAHVWSKIEAEKFIDVFSAEDHFPVLVLRPVSIYGKGMLFRWPELFELIRRRRMRLIGDGNSPYPLVHVEDLARAVLLGLELPNLSKTEKVIIDSEEPLTFRAIVSFIAGYFGVPEPSSIPYPLARAAACMLAAVPDFLKPPALRLVTPLSVREYRYGHGYVTDKAKTFLGFRSELGFREGMGEMLDAYTGRRAA